MKLFIIPLKQSLDFPKLSVIKIIDNSRLLPCTIHTTQFLSFRDDWKIHFHSRNLVALSANPLLIYPVRYTNEPGYVSDTENSTVIVTNNVKKDELWSFDKCPIFLKVLLSECCKTNYSIFIKPGLHLSTSRICFCKPRSASQCQKLYRVWAWIVHVYTYILW